MASIESGVFGGVDTHEDVHVAAAVDGAGRLLGTAAFDAGAEGCGRLAGVLGAGAARRGGGDRQLRGRAGPLPGAVPAVMVQVRSPASAWVTVSLYEPRLHVVSITRGLLTLRLSVSHKNRRRPRRHPAPNFNSKDHITPSTSTMGHDNATMLVSALSKDTLLDARPTCIIDD